MDFIKWERFPEITAITTTRADGNMAYQVDNGQGVAERRVLLAKALGVSSGHMTFVHQTHSDIILETKKEDIGKGALDFASGMPSDALYTTIKGLPLGIFHADCVPVFLYDPKSRLVAIIHSGHQGTMKEITFKSVRYLIGKGLIKADDAHFHLGPSRKKESYIVQDSEALLIKGMGYGDCLSDSRDGIHFDMPKMNVEMLLKLGIPEGNIDVSPLDTHDNEKLFSAYDKSPVGRMTSIIMLNA